MDEKLLAQSEEAAAAAPAEPTKSFRRRRLKSRRRRHRAAIRRAFRWRLVVVLCVIGAGAFGTLFYYELQDHLARMRNPGSEVKMERVSFFKELPRIDIWLIPTGGLLDANAVQRFRTESQCNTLRAQTGATEPCHFEFPADVPGVVVASINGPGNRVGPDGIHKLNTDDDNTANSNAAIPISQVLLGFPEFQNASYFISVLSPTHEKDDGVELFLLPKFQDALVLLTAVSYNGKFEYRGIIETRLYDLFPTPNHVMIQIEWQTDLITFYRDLPAPGLYGFLILGALILWAVYEALDRGMAWIRGGRAYRPLPKARKDSMAGADQRSTTGTYLTDVSTVVESSADPAIRFAEFPDYEEYEDDAGDESDPDYDMAWPELQRGVQHL